jgi:anti-anti-sigma regulatory factor
MTIAQMVKVASVTSRGRGELHRGPLYERAESIRREALDTTPSGESFHVSGVHVDDGMILSLHGDLNLCSVPNLQAVLDGLVLLQPRRLVIDLSGVNQVSPDALQLIAHCALRIDDVVVRSPSPATRVDLVKLGHSDLLEPTLVSSHSV